MSADISIIAGLHYSQIVKDLEQTVTVTGPRGTVRAWNIGIIDDGYYEQYPDRLWELYITLCETADGLYHCCLTGNVERLS